MRQQIGAGGSPGRVERALDCPRELHPAGERRPQIAGTVADDAADGVRLEIEDDRQPGAVRWHAEDDARTGETPHRG